MADTVTAAVKAEAAKVKAAKAVAKSELKEVKTLEELKAFGKARGYNEGWAEATFKARMEARARWAQQRAERQAAADRPGPLEISS